VDDRPVAPALAVSLFAISLIIWALAGCSSNGEATAGDRTATVTVFAAASLTEAFTALGDAFEEAEPGASVEFSFGPSSELTAQLAEGAPADVLATADEATMADAVGARTIDGEPTRFASNHMEIAVAEGNPVGVTGLDDLADDDLVIGLCAEEVPCGRLARQALRSAGVQPSVDTDEADVKALLAKIAAGEVDAGLVYRTDVRAADDDVDGIGLPEAQQVVTRYPLATVAGSAHADRARDFVAFVASPDGRAILERFGFGPP
jgi:molybdate transport system substrate-binding protein